MFVGGLTEYMKQIDAILHLSRQLGGIDEMHYWRLLSGIGLRHQGVTMCSSASVYHSSDSLIGRIQQH